MALPTFEDAEINNPVRIFLYSHPKVGKTTLLSGLPNNLIIDTENGSNSVPGIKFNLIKEAKKKDKTPLIMYRALANAISKGNAEKGDFVYDYISIDTTTGMEKLALELATTNYKKSVIGKNYQGDNVVTDIPSGGGHMWFRNAFEELYKLYDGLSRYGLISTGHVKLTSIPKDGVDVAVTDINLTGKLKDYIVREVDAIGTLERNKENLNQVMVSFITDPRNLAIGARQRHLANKKFVLSELQEDGTFKFFWDKIYLNNNNKNKGETNG